MTTDEIIERSLENGDITVDFDTGKVYGYRVNGRKRLDEPRELGCLAKTGYVCVRLNVDGENRLVLAHRIVYTAAYGAIPEGMVIDHVNNDKTDNRIANLQLMTAAGNHRKAWFDGRHRWVKTTEEDREEIAREHEEGGRSYREIAEEHGISKPRAAAIVREYRESQEDDPALAGVEWLDGDDVA